MAIINSIIQVTFLFNFFFHLILLSELSHNLMYILIGSITYIKLWKLYKLKTQLAKNRIIKLIECNYIGN
jgi:hypothetical protein